MNLKRNINDPLWHAYDENKLAQEVYQACSDAEEKIDLAIKNYSTLKAKKEIELEQDKEILLDIVSDLETMICELNRPHHDLCCCSICTPTIFD